MKYHMLAFFLGFLLDLVLGDPYCLPHPIRLIGNLIGALEKKLNREEKEAALRNGYLMVILVTGITTCSVALLFGGTCFLEKHYLPASFPYLRVGMETILTYYVLATKCLKVESMKVYRALKEGDVEKARYAVSMIVGRDTRVLDQVGIAKAAIETVAENTSDGIIAPMLYAAIGGPVLAFLYKSINTMDSMIGYKNEKYLYFGRGAAKLDDLVNYLPSRISAYLMMLACGCLSLFSKETYSMKDAYRIHKRDSRKHASPNSAQTESTCAGALGIMLAGDATYFGVLHKKPLIGDAKRPVEYEDIPRANALLYGTAILCQAVCLILMGVCAYV